MRIQVVRSKEDADWIVSLTGSCFEKQIPVQVVDVFLCFDIQDYDALFHVWFHALREYSRVHTWEAVCRRRYFRVADTGRRFWIKPADFIDGKTYFNAGEAI